MQAGTVSRLPLCRRSWGFKIHFWRNIVRFWKSYICTNKMDVQEINFSFAQLNRIWNHLFGHWTESGTQNKKREHQLYYCNPDWMISGGQFLWNAIAICEMSKTSWQTGKLGTNEDLVNRLKDQLFHLAHWWNISQIPWETKREFINSERKYYQESFSVKLCSREEFGRETFWLLILKNQKRCMHQKFIPEDCMQKKS